MQFLCDIIIQHVLTKLLYTYIGNVFCVSHALYTPNMHVIFISHRDLAPLGIAVRQFQQSFMHNEKNLETK